MILYAWRYHRPTHMELPNTHTHTYGIHTHTHTHTKKSRKNQWKSRKDQWKNQWFDFMLDVIVGRQTWNCQIRTLNLASTLHKWSRYSNVTMPGARGLYVLLVLSTRYAQGPVQCVPCDSDEHRVGASMCTSERNVKAPCVLGQTNSSNECGDLQSRYPGDSSTVKPSVQHFSGAVLTGYFTVQRMFS